MDRTEAQSRYELAQQIAVEAGRLTLKHFRTASLSVERKGDDSPLTIADQEAERYLRAAIADHFPDDAIVGEEFGVTDGTSGFRWILDPIDGTKSFICGVPLYGTMVAVDWGKSYAAENRDCVIGSVYLPGLEEGIHAMTGGGAWYFTGTQSPIAAHASRNSELRDCVVATSEVETFAERNAAAAWPALTDAMWFGRTWGDVYGYLLLATGQIDVMIDPILNIWDAAAVMPIVEEAGGTFSDWQGQRRIDSGDAVATNGLTHAAVLEILASQ